MDTARCPVEALLAAEDRCNPRIAYCSDIFLRIFALLELFLLRRPFQCE
jgi:hypothetical protein